MEGFGQVRGGKVRVLTLVGVGAMAVGTVSIFGATAGGHSAVRRAGTSAARRSSSTVEGHLLYAERTKDVVAPPKNPSGRASALIDCPASHPHVTGGGVDTSGGSNARDVEVGSTVPATHGSWLGEVNNGETDRGGARKVARRGGQPADASMTVTVICKKHGKFRYSDAEKANPGGGQILKGVNCPPGTKLTGGGVETHGDNTAEVASSEPADGPDQNSKRDDRWLGAANDGPMSVSAVCAKTGTAGIYRYTQSARKDLPDPGFATAIANCPSGFVVTGGGVDITGVDDSLEVQASTPLEAHGWLGQAINDFSGRDEKMQTFAICKKK
jgi:hypothetical protein